MGEKNKFIVVSFCTRDTPYIDVIAEYLVPSLKKFNLKYNIITYDNLKNWNKNVALKPLAILETMAKYPDHDIVCLDADSTIETYPILFEDLQCDLACHRLDWGTHYGHNEGRKEILSGTLFIRNNLLMKSFVERWRRDSIPANNWEQRILADCLVEMRGKGMVVKDLPREYCYINTLPNGDLPKVEIKDPVIIHHQVSRKLKRIINRG